MPALNFQKQFVDAVVAGLKGKCSRDGGKTQTIRSLRKRPIRKGDNLFLFTGMRQKGCRLLGSAICTEAITITLCEEYLVINGIRICLMDRLNALAQDDGFKTWSEMIAWFNQRYGLPFHGQLIQWQSTTRW